MMQLLIERIYIWFYALNVRTAVSIAILVCLAWTLLYVLLSQRKPKLWNRLNAVVLFLAVCVIGYTTLCRTGYERQLVLQPFHTLQRAMKNKEAYREALMNAVLFLPIGLTVPYLLPKRWSCGRRIWVSVAVGLGFSLLLEILQYAFSLGTTETDDVLTNTLGTLLGALPLLMTKRWHTACRSKSEN